MLIHHFIMSSSEEHRYSTARQQLNSAAERNKEPFLEMLKKWISPVPSVEGGPSVFCLEILSISGQCVAHLARHFPFVLWQPSVCDAISMGRIRADVLESGLSNILPPMEIDVSEDFGNWGGGGRFKENSIDYVLNIGMIHMSPLSCTQGLFRNCGKLLKPGGLLFTYGLYSFNGKIIPESNVHFDAMLRAKNAEWGLWDVQKELIPLAVQNNLCLLEIVNMAAYDKVLVWKKNQAHALM